MKEAEKFLVDNELDKTHWGKRIIKAESISSFNAKDVKDSKDWPTCALGAVVSENNIPFDENDDILLTSYGTSFYFGVYSNNYLQAAQYLLKIENGVKKFIKRIESKT